MGVLNITPDSFFDGGKITGVDQAVEKALKMVEDGADIIDIGGESTGPGSVDVPVEEEIKRTIPIFEKLRDRTKALLSIDTYKSKVAIHALNVGADMVNDVTAFRGDEDMADFLGKYDSPIVIMYSKDNSARTTQKNVQYKDVVKDISEFLIERIEFAKKSGIDPDRLILDPGMGAFVSSDERYSLQIIKSLGEFKKLGMPLLVGASRKSFVGNVLNLPVNERLEGSLAAAAISVWNGASIIRTHDVKETRRIVDMVGAIIKS